MSNRKRLPGEAFGVERNYIPTFDNAATTTQLQVMARAHQATGEEKYRKAFLKGLYLILEAQFPNGGWPQSFPLVGGYHDYITYNDEIISDILALLLNVAEKNPPYGIAPEIIRQKAANSFRRGLDCVLKTQIIANGRKTAWAAQYDTFTLEPRQARAYEPVSLASRESADMVNFLMSLPNPSPEVIDAIESAIAWFNKVKIDGYRWQLKIGVSSAFTADPGAGPLWARFYEIGSNRPIFGDRDGSIHYELSGVSEERRIGYGWYSYIPLKMLEQHSKWRNGLRVFQSRNKNDEQ
jgi:PelA/Pel-15E family pectate lyase